MCICNIFLSRDLRDRNTIAQMCLFNLETREHLGRVGVTSSSRGSLARKTFHEFVYRKTLRFRSCARVWRTSRRFSPRLRLVMILCRALAYLLFRLLQGRSLEKWFSDTDRERTTATVSFSGIFELDVKVLLACIIHGFSGGSNRLYFIYGVHRLTLSWHR